MYRILIVDDTPTNIKFLHDILRHDYKVSVAMRGVDAIKLVAKEPPDIILLDIMMPEMDGYEVCEILKANPETAKIPIIFVTAKVETEDEEKGLTMGAVDYLSKPVSPPIALARIRNHLELKQAREHLEEEVAQRTKELDRKVKELEARDQLLHLQTQGLSKKKSGEAIIRALGEVLEADAIALLTPDNRSGKLSFTSEYSFSVIESLKVLETDEAYQIATETFQDKRLNADNAELLCSPIIFEDHIFGVVLVSLPNKEDSATDSADVLWRMSTEAAMVLRIVSFSDDLENDALDLDDLDDLLSFAESSL
ncbi:MAG: response regulator [Desulfotalea sp.]